ncbi:MAG: hypothetical protein LBD88_02080 [Candidatus Peribacteria bacterium]|jgi:hypothetical protein|nr:hypothetical protein [Candidatus Peribacteria bacterium]
MTQYFAFFVFSSSQPDNKYIIQLKITPKTAITAINLVNSEIMFAMKLNHAFQTCSASSSHQGSPSQCTGGQLVQLTKSTIEKKIRIKTQIYFFIIDFGLI